MRKITLTNEKIKVITDKLSALKVDPTQATASKESEEDNKNIDALIEDIKSKLKDKVITFTDDIFSNGIKINPTESLTAKKGAKGISEPKNLTYFYVKPSRYSSEEEENNSIAAWQIASRSLFELQPHASGDASTISPGDLFKELEFSSNKEADAFLNTFLLDFGQTHQQRTNCTV